MTSVGCCGFECGQLGAVGQHWGTATGISTQTTTARNSRGRAMQVNVTAAAATSTFVRTLSLTVSIQRFYINFTTLPSADCFLAWMGAANNANTLGLVFKQSDSKLYAGRGSTIAFGATGVSVTTGVWYRIDLKTDQTSGTNLTKVDVQVDGSAVGQLVATNSGQGSTFNFGCDRAVTANFFVDDFVTSTTSADYPIGKGAVRSYIANADGTHTATGTDIVKGTVATPVGTAITNVTTDAFNWLNAEPLLGGATDNTRLINQQTAAAEYIEVKFGPGTGMPAATAAPRAVEVIAADREASTATCNFITRIFDNATNGDVVNRGTVAGVVTDRYAAAHFATAPSAVAWNLVASGNGSFPNLRARFGFSSDATPDVYIRGIMIEAEFDEANAYTLTATQASMTLTPKAVTALDRGMPATQASMTLTPQNAGFIDTMQATQASLVLTPQALTALDRTMPAAQASLVITPNSAGFINTMQAVQASITLTPQAASIRKTTYILAAPTLNLTLTAQNAPLTWGHLLPTIQASLTLTPQAVTSLDRGMQATQASLVMTPNTVGFINTIQATQASLVITTFDAALLKGKTLTAGQASLSLTPQSANLLFDRVLSATQRNLTISAFSANLLKADKLSAVQASLVITSNSANFTAAHLLSATQASLSLARFTANLTEGHVLLATQANLTITPFSTNLLTAKRLGATVANLVITSNNANLTHSYLLPTTQASLAITRFSTGFIFNHVLTAGSANLVLTPESATLTHTSANELLAGSASLTLTPSNVVFYYGRVLNAVRAQIELLRQTATLTAPFREPDTFVPSLITPSPFGADNEIPAAGYCNLPREIKWALNRGEQFYLGVELYLPTEDEIWADPKRALFCFSDTRFRWENRIYRDKVSSINDLTKFIGKTFNNFSLDLVNVERGKGSGSVFVFKNLIRGFRVGVRIIFPELPVKFSRLVWWGRVAKTEDITENSVKVNCSQEIGDFSYELATKKYGQACPLFFGKGECLGTETLEQKSLLYQAAFRQFGQGGCNRTEARCIQLANRPFYQGQNTVTITGQFIRDEVTVKKFLFFFKIHKHNRIPVQWSSANQSPNQNVTIPIILGRAKVELHPFAWADIGTQIIALMGGCVGPIQGFYNITCQNDHLTLADVTQHLGELGGVGTQQPDGRFIQSGENSRLAYCGLTYSGSPPADEPEEVPTTTAVIKGWIIPVRNAFSGQFIKDWSNNPVWLVRNLLMNFPYTVVREQWFNEIKNQETANYCFTVIEDDTDGEIPVISGSSYQDYQNGRFARYTSTNRYNVDTLETSFQSFRAQNELSQSLVPIVIDEPSAGGSPDIWWPSPIGSSAIGQSRTYLALRYTANGVINDKAKLSDILFSLLLPTFRGYIRFNHFGKIEIDCRKPVDNTFIRLDTSLASTEIPVASVVKFSTPCGFLLIGVGKGTSEIAKIKGIRYVNGCSQTQVSATCSGSLGVTVSPAFIDRGSAPAEIYLDFNGTPTVGESISLKFIDPVDGQTAQNELLWDYFCDAETSQDAALLFKTRLMASPVFRETWTAEIFPEFPNRVIIRCQTGYIELDRPLINTHLQGEEILRVVEVYEDGKDEQSINGVHDNMSGFNLNVRKQETYHGVTGTYISAVQDFRETQIQPRIAWDAAEQERNLNLLDIDLRFVDNYRQAAFLTKSATVDFVDGNLYATWKTGVKALFHEEGECVAVRHQTMEGISYTPFTIEDLSYNHSAMETSLTGKLYLSAAFDERVAKEEKFLEASLVPNPDFPVAPPPTLSLGGYSTTGTGDGAGNRRQEILYETQTYETLPNQQKYSPEGRDKL